MLGCLCRLGALATKRTTVERENERETGQLERERGGRAVDGPHSFYWGRGGGALPKASGSGFVRCASGLALAGHIHAAPQHWQSFNFRQKGGGRAQHCGPRAAPTGAAGRARVAPCWYVAQRPVQRAHAGDSCPGSAEDRPPAQLLPMVLTGSVRRTAQAGVSGEEGRRDVHRMRQ